MDKYQHALMLMQLIEKANEHRMTAIGGLAQRELNEMNEEAKQEIAAANAEANAAAAAQAEIYRQNAMAALKAEAGDVDPDRPEPAVSRTATIADNKARRL